jgi:hypothetical protein
MLEALNSRFHGFQHVEKHVSKPSFMGFMGFNMLKNMCHGLKDVLHLANGQLWGLFQKLFDGRLASALG